MSKRKVLVLSGGGVKGVLQVEILKELEKKGELKDINLIVGSSVGAINGTILASGKLTANELCNLYPNMLKEIFKKKLISFIPPIYDRKNFIGVWQKLIGTMKLKDLKTSMIISAIDFCKKETHFFKSYSDGDDDVLNTVLKSFSAPYYFGFLPDPQNQRVFGDGGMGDDNLPITESILETINLNWFNDNDDVKFIVIGTGFVDITEPYNTVVKEGFIRQAFDFIKPGDGGFSRMVSRTEQLGQLEFISNKYNNIHFDYYDIQIPKSLDKMDAMNYITQYKQYGMQASMKPLLSN